MANAKEEAVKYLIVLYCECANVVTTFMPIVSITEGGKHTIESLVCCKCEKEIRFIDGVLQMENVDKVVPITEGGDIGAEKTQEQG